jgi:hypothetical protein
MTHSQDLKTKIIMLEQHEVWTSILTQRTLSKEIQEKIYKKGPCSATSHTFPNALRTLFTEQCLLFLPACLDMCQATLSVKMTIIPSVFLNNAKTAVIYGHLLEGITVIYWEDKPDAHVIEAVRDQSTVCYSALSCRVVCRTIPLHDTWPRS